MLAELMVKFIGLFLVCSMALAESEFRTCLDDSAHQARRSQELKQLEEQDQADRKGPFESIDWEKVRPRDLERRIRVAAIFAEGCINSAADHGYAALIYQHGDSPGHFYQAFIWANKAVQLGDDSKRWLTAAALDRYLVKSGQKQLFGTQFGMNAAKNWCLEPLEKSFPEARRFEYLKMNLRESIAIFLNFYSSPLTPEDVQNCSTQLIDTPLGSVPGFW